MRPGDVVLLRSVYRRRVRWTFPHRLVEDEGTTVALYCGPGAQGKGMRMRRDRGGAYLERWRARRRTVRQGWSSSHDEPRAAGLRWTTRSGVLDTAQAAALRAEGQRVVAERPWPTGWADWRPPSDWTPTPLPEGWDVV
jgi:hypothetical protein